jgi:hypothetical protein
MTVGVASVDWAFFAFFAAGAFAFAAPTEYLCYRRGWGLGVRLPTWAAGATLIGVLYVLGLPSEEVCLALDKERPGSCDDFWRGFTFALPIIAGLLLVLWSVLYVTAAMVCRSIYRHMLT